MPVGSDARRAVAFRSYRGLYQDVAEQYFSIDWAPRPDSFEATLVIPSGASIQQQLLEMHMGKPSASLEVLLQKLRIQRFTMRGSECPQIAEQMEILNNLQFSVPKFPEGHVFLHAYVYRITVNFLGGEIDARTQVDEHPLVKWSIATRAKLMECIPDRSPDP